MCSEPGRVRRTVYIAELNNRIERAAMELAAMITSGIGAAITGQAWDRYQHSSNIVPILTAPAGKSSSTRCNDVGNRRCIYDVVLDVAVYHPAP